MDGQCYLWQFRSVYSGHSAAVLHAPRSKLLAPSSLQKGKSTDVGSFPLRRSSQKSSFVHKGKEIYVEGEEEKKLRRKGYI